MGKFGAGTLVLILFAVAAPLGAAQERFRIEGRVYATDEKSGLLTPVEGAVVRRINSAEWDDDSKRVQSVATDREGRYLMEVEEGHHCFLPLIPPPGYICSEIEISQILVTKEQPVAIKDYEVKRGATLRIFVRSPRGSVQPNQTTVSLSHTSGKPEMIGYNEADEQGAATITVQRLEGQFSLEVVQTFGPAMLWTPSATIEFEPGFNPKRTMNAIQRNASGKLTATDEKGKKATAQGCDLFVDGGDLRLAMDGVDGSKATLKQLKGRVVNDRGQGVAGARVELRIGELTKPQRYVFQVVRSDQEGRFVGSIFDPQRAVVSVIVNSAPGYVPNTFNNLRATLEKDGNAKVEPLVVEKGHSIHLKVVGSKGKPLAGALVTPRGRIAMGTLEKRTDQNGECVIEDLPLGQVGLAVVYGDVYEACKVTVKENDRQPVVLKAISTPMKSSKAAEVRTPISVGEAAPAWKVSEWIDGEKRSFADYRGKVVLLQFTGVWCSACENSIPAIQELQARYAGREDVAFVAIHTAGTDRSVIDRFLKHHRLEIAMGIDEGEEAAGSETAAAYRVRGFPTYFIIGRDGRVHFNSSTDMERILAAFERHAKALGIPWPQEIPTGRDLSEEERMEIVRRFNKVFAATCAEEIDAALNAKTQ